MKNMYMYAYRLDIIFIIRNSKEHEDYYIQKR